MDDMDGLGPLVAEGRAAEIRDAGPGLVAKVARYPTDLEREARAMGIARAAGIAVPAVHSVTDGVIVMERVEGKTAMSVLESAPWKLAAVARLLAEVQAAIHQVVPRSGVLPTAPLPGDRLLHLDLHPDNIIMASTGPVVIDWANASTGDPRADVAMSWIIMASSDIPVRQPARFVLDRFRHRFVNRWLAHSDREAARTALATMGSARTRDPNVTPREAARVEELVLRHGR